MPNKTILSLTFFLLFNTHIYVNYQLPSFIERLEIAKCFHFFEPQPDLVDVLIEEKFDKVANNKSSKESKKGGIWKQMLQSIIKIMIKCFVSVLLKEILNEVFSQIKNAYWRESCKYILKLLTSIMTSAMFYAVS